MKWTIDNGQLTIAEVKATELLTCAVMKRAHDSAGTDMQAQASAAAKAAALLIFVCLIPACKPPMPEKIVVREYVALPCPPPQIPPRPMLPSTALGESPTLADLIRALLGDREVLAAWGFDLEIRLKAYLKEDKHD